MIIVRIRRGGCGDSNRPARRLQERLRMRVFIYLQYNGVKKLLAQPFQSHKGAGQNCSGNLRICNYERYDRFRYDLPLCIYVLHWVINPIHIQIPGLCHCRNLWHHGVGFESQLILAFINLLGVVPVDHIGNVPVGVLLGKPAYGGIIVSGP